MRPRRIRYNISESNEPEIVDFVEISTSGSEDDEDDERNAAVVHAANFSDSDSEDVQDHELNANQNGNNAAVVPDLGLVANIAVGQNDIDAQNQIVKLISLDLFVIK